MGRRYYFVHSDTEGNSFMGSFTNPAYQGEEIELEGNAVMVDDASGNPFQPLQAKRCNVNLRATIEQPLDDLYDEDDRYWLFRYQKLGGDTLFQGYAYTEGMEQPYNSKEWFLNFDCMDHLTYLEEFGYYDDDGLPYLGRADLLTIILNCLAKGFNLPSERLGIRTRHYLTLAGSNLYTNTYLDQGQFYNEDGEADSCKKVLGDILGSLGCFIKQEQLHWWVVPVRDWARFNSNPITFLDFSSAGTQTGNVVLTNLTSEQRIGDDINGVPTHHVNEPSFVKNKFYNSFRVRHDYEYADQILSNGDLESSGPSMPGWTLGASASVNGDTIEIDGVQLAASTEEALRSTPVFVKENDTLVLTINAEYVDDPTDVYYQLLLTGGDSGDEYSYRVILNVEENTSSQSSWLTLPVGSLVEHMIKVSFVNEGEHTHEIQVPALPEAGSLQFIAWRPIFGSAHTASSKSIISSVQLKALEKPIEAEEFTITRTDKKTGKVPDVENIRFNTSDRNILRNIFTDVDGTAVAAFRHSESGADVIMAEELAREHLKLFSINHKSWNGDVFNNVPFRTKRIDFMGGPYLVVNESKDYTTNISNVQMVEVGLYLPLHSLESRRVFRNAVRPTLKIT